MPTDVIMPQMGESIFEGTITKWLKKPGDAVEKDEPLFEISTDKVDAEIPSPAAGVLGEIKFPEGTTVQINAVVAVLNDAGLGVKSSNGPAAQSPAKAPTPKTQEAKVEAAQPAHAPKGGGTEVVMPQMGESIFEGTITKWLKKPGDTVAKDEPLFEISTDKVDAEIPSPLDGILTEIRAAEGATVQINTVVAVIGGSGPAVAKSVAAPEKVALVPAQAAQAHVEPPSNVQAPGSGEGIRSSPLVRKIAKEHNVDLSQIRGTGSAGRINKEDILRHLVEVSRGSIKVTGCKYTCACVDSRNRADVADAGAHRTAHDRKHAHDSACAQRLQGGHDAHRAPARSRAERI